MILPTGAELRAVLLRASTRQTSFTMATLADAVAAYLEERYGAGLSENWCSESGCPYRRVDGMLTCPEHTAQRLNDALRRQADLEHELDVLQRRFAAGAGV